MHYVRELVEEGVWISWYEFEFGLTILKESYGDLPVLYVYMILYIYMFVMTVTVYYAIYIPNYLEVKNVISEHKTDDRSLHCYLAGDAQEKTKSDHIQEYLINKL
jgi:hypothetical protein